MSFLLSLGFWLSIPSTGWAMLRIFSPRLLENLRFERRTTQFVTLIVIGIASWSIPLLLFMILSLFNGRIIGVIGWFIFLISVYFMRQTLMNYFKQGSLLKEDFRNNIDKWEVIFILMLVAMSFIYFWFPHESMFGGRDQGVYSNSAVYIAQNGNLKVNYPVFDSSDYQNFMPGLYNTKDTITVQFSHLFSVWMAQAYSTIGIQGLLAVNSIFGLLSVIMFRFLLSQYVSKIYSVVGSIFIGFNVSQVWMSRITLTEIFTQMFIISALFMGAKAFNKKEAVWGSWAGFFLGLAVLCRIDSLLLLPFMVSSNLVFNIIIDQSDKQSLNKIWWNLFSVFIPIVFISFGYYYFYTRPYFLDLLPRLTQILLLTAALTLIHFFHGGIKKIISRYSLILYNCILFIVVLLFLYAHLIRPYYGTFSLFSIPNHGLDGTRTFRENSILNLSNYLSVPIIYMGLIGWLLALRKIIFQKDYKWILPTFLVGGFSVLYLYDPNISPDHFWANRRFVPIIIPGFVFFAFFTLEYLINILRKFNFSYISRLLIAVIGIYLIIFNIYNLQPIAFYKEQDNVWSNIRSIADYIPDGTLLVTEDVDTTTRYATPLFMSFSKKVVPLNSLTDEGRNKLIKYIMENPSQKVFLLNKGNQNPIGLKTNLINVFDEITTETEKVTSGLPREQRGIKDKLYLFELLPVKNEDLYLGASFVEGTLETGFYSEEYVGNGTRYRWTDGNAEIIIPNKHQKKPKLLQISLIHTGPDDRDMTINVNEQEVYRGKTNKDTKELIIPLKDIPTEKEDLKIQITTKSWSPSELGANDPRKLGVAVGLIRFIYDDIAMKTEDVNMAVSNIERFSSRPEMNGKSNGKELLFNIKIENRSTSYWPSRAYSSNSPVRIGYIWFDKSDLSKRMGEGRTDLSYSMFPGDTLIEEVILEPKDYNGNALPQGNYEVWIGLVKEGKMWFYNEGDRVLKVDYKVD